MCAIHAHNKCTCYVTDSVLVKMHTNGSQLVQLSNLHLVFGLDTGAA